VADGISDLPARALQTLSPCSNGLCPFLRRLHGDVFGVAMPDRSAVIA
jgi:hypothetical protein